MLDPISDITSRAKALDKPMSRILQRAKVDWSQWARYTQKTASPTLRVLNRIYEALDQMEAEDRYEHLEQIL